MSRTARVAPGGLIYHALNRTVAGLPLFRKQADYEAFTRIMLDAHRRHPIRVLAWSLMPNHWHFVLWPQTDGELTAHLRWLSHTHAMRWHVAHGTVGRGHLYQGRFKSFPVQDDEYFLRVCRNVERNALTANLVQRAEDWRWSSLWTRTQGDTELGALLSDWPVERPSRWLRLVNEPLSAKEQAAIAISMRRNRPYGDSAWQAEQAQRLGLLHTFRREGRPRKAQT